MSASYPDSIKTFREIQDLPGIAYDEAAKTTVYAKDTTDAYEEIRAIEQTLGTNPNGSFEDVASRLDSIEGLPAYVRLKDGTGFYLQNDTVTILNFDSIIENTRNNYDAPTATFTCTKDGIVSVMLTLSLDAPFGTNNMQVFFNVNGITVRAFENRMPNGYITTSFVDSFRCSEGDEITVLAYQNSGNDIELGYYDEYNVLVIQEL